MICGSATTPFLGASVLGYRPAALPAPSAIAHWTLESPLPGALALVVVGFLLFLWFNREGRAKRGLLIGGVVALAGAGLFTLGSLVQTARERVLHASREFVAAASVGDGVALGWLLADDVSLSVDGATSARINKVDLVRGAAGVKESGLVEGHSLLVNDAAIDGPGVGRSQVHVRSDGGRGVMAFTWWTLYWRMDPDGEWRVTRIDWLTLNGRAPAEGITLEIEKAGEE